MKPFKQIGTVEILRQRIYPLDPLNYQGGTEVVVEPGVFPVLSNGISRLWMMTGKIMVTSLGDGMFIFGSQNADGPEVTFPSRTYGEEQWTDLMGDPMCDPDSPDCRLVFTIEDDSW